MATKAVQIISISTALASAGGIATLSLFDVPMLQSQPASRSLPMTRWLFSRGSHIFPTSAFVSSAGFAYLAYEALPLAERTLPGLLRHAGASGRIGLYLAASALTMSIAPWTQLVMIPTNFALIAKNEQKGGSRSLTSAKRGATGGRSAEESVDSKDDVSQWEDVSGPQSKTKQDTTEEENAEVQRLLEKFGRLNAVRSVLIGVGGIVGLSAALL